MRLRAMAGPDPAMLFCLWPSRTTEFFLFSFVIAMCTLRSVRFSGIDEIN
jgi:hypothetical protein